MAEKKQFKRLSRAVRPTHYNIQLQPDLEKFTFTGSETVDVEVKKSTQRFSINSLDVRVHSAIFIGKDETFEASSVSYDKEEEKVTFKFPLSLPLGKAQLKIEFDGELNDKMRGFYRSKYTTPGGEERHCAVTHFEPTDARRAFPCWDEPAIKATFDITLVAPKGKVAISNMNVIDECDHEQIDSLRIVKFATTPVMSTYLVAFIVGEFDYVEDTSSDGVLVRVYTPLGKSEQGQFGLQVAVKTLPFYKEYFGIAYPLNKMDLIAIPDFPIGDTYFIDPEGIHGRPISIVAEFMAFSNVVLACGIGNMKQLCLIMLVGAMENWGLLTYRETALLVDPKQSSAAAKQWVALVVGHEIAHQWFGNLEWWTHLWLKEGFATWIEYLCVDHCFPEYDIWTQFTTTDYSCALELDALDNSHPIEVPVGHPSEIDEIFDAISYCKGASVLRMLHEYIGNDDFRKGLNCYLEDFKFSNGKTEDLWAALENASKKPVGRIMTTWTKQMGFPVISVDSEQNGSTRILKLKQSKFSSCGAKDNSDYHWMVPITITTSQRPDKTCMQTLLGDKEMVIYMNDLPADAWVKFNTGQVCYYRVKYSSEMLKSLVPAIKNQILPPVDRLGIESDMFAMAQAGLASTVDYLTVLEGFLDEGNYTVWNDIASNVAQLAVILQVTDYYSEFTNYCLNLFLKIGEKVNWNCSENEGHLDSLLRSLILGRLGRYGHQATVAECKRRFTDHCSGCCEVPADLRGCVYGTVIAHGDCDTLAAMIRLYKECDHMEEKSRLLRCMGSTNNGEIVKRVLEFSISDDVRSQDTVFAIGGCTSSALGRQITWDFMKEHWSELNTRYDGGSLLSRLVRSTTENFCSMEHYNDIKSFFEANPTPSAERAIQQSLESIKLNTMWLERDGRPIKEYLSSKDSCCSKGECKEQCQD